MAVYKKQYEDADYEKLCRFLIELNIDKKHMNWNWARLEWSYFHSDADFEQLGKMALWFSGEKIIGAAIYDQYPGEGFCGVLPGFEYLLPELVKHAKAELSDENGIGIAAADDDFALLNALTGCAFIKGEQEEPMLHIQLCKELEYSLPEGFTIKEIQLPMDSYQYQLVLWKGFNHGSNICEFEKTLKEKAHIRPHANTQLRLAISDLDGNFAAHCQCWYLPYTDYAYIEPVCVIPEFRMQGFGKAIVYEALNRCRSLGAKEGFVQSNKAFYHSIGFAAHSNFNFYWAK